MSYSCGTFNAPLYVTSKVKFSIWANEQVFNRPLLWLWSSKSSCVSFSADLSCSHLGSTLSLATEADSVISGGAESQRYELPAQRPLWVTVTTHSTWQFSHLVDRWPCLPGLDPCAPWSRCLGWAGRRAGTWRGTGRTAPSPPPSPRWSTVVRRHAMRVFIWIA